MKNVLFTLFAFLLTVSYSPNFKASERNHIKVHPELQKHYIRFVRLAEANNLNIDWSQIEAVELIPMRTNIQGYYARHSKTVIISYYYSLPLMIKLSKQEVEDIIFLTLAHEIGHSQGLMHVEVGKMDLMHPDARYDVKVVKGMGVEQYIVNTLKAKL